MSAVISQLNGSGIHHREIAFCGGRLSVRASRILHGFDHVMFGGVSGKDWQVFRRDVDADLERNVEQPYRVGLQLEFDDRPLVFQRLETFPFGYVNEQDGCRSRLCVRDRALLFEASARSIRIRIDVPSFRYPMKGISTTVDEQQIHWQSFEQKADHVLFHKVVPWVYTNMACGVVKDAVSNRLKTGREIHHVYVAFAGNGGIKLERGEGELSVSVTPAAGQEARLAMGFGDTAEDALRDARALAMAGPAAFEEERVRYARIAEALPKLQFGRHMQLPEYFALQPLYLESMRIGDKPGAFRANNDYYWVWSWDMTRCHTAMAMSGRQDFLRANMEFIDSGKLPTGEGICEYDGTLNRDLREQFDWDFMPAMLGLHQFCSWSGDLEFARKVYPGFRNTFNYLQRHMDPGTCLIPGGASTDFPEEFGRTWGGRNAYCNGWWYTAARMFAKLAARLGDSASAAAAEAVADSVGAAFLPTFWNEKTGFLNENVDPASEDHVCDIPLTTAYAACDGIYGDELLAERADRIAAYARKHFVTTEGIHIMPVGDPRGYKEWHRMTNNWFTVNDCFTLRLMRDTGHFDAINMILYQYEWNFGLHRSALEGKPFTRPLYCSNTWQAFGCSAWYRAIVETGAGIDMDLGGLTVVPTGIGERIRLTGMPYREAAFDFITRGQGRYIQALRLNGAPVTGTYKIQPPTTGRFTVEVDYSSHLPPTPILLKALDTPVHMGAVNAEGLEAELECSGFTAVKFHARGRPSVTVNGQPKTVEWNPGQQTAWIRFRHTGKAQVSLRLDG